MRLHRLRRIARERGPRVGNRVPQAEHDHAWVAHAHRPGERLHGYFFDAAPARGVRVVQDLAVVVVIAGKGVPDVAYAVGDVDGDFGIQHVLVLFPCADGDRVSVVFFERRFAFGDGGGGVFFSEGTAGGAWFAEEGNVGEEDGGEVGYFVGCVWEFGFWEVCLFEDFVVEAGVRVETLLDPEFPLYQPFLLRLCVVQEIDGGLP